MRSNDEKLQRESDAAFAFASFLLNLLVLLVITGSVWLVYAVLIESNAIGVLLRETAWR